MSEEINDFIQYVKDEIGNSNSPSEQRELYLIKSQLLQAQQLERIANILDETTTVDENGNRSIVIWPQ